MFSQLAAAFADARSRRDVLALQLVGNLLLMLLLWFWLGMGVGSIAMFATLLLLGIVLLSASALLHGSGLAAFRPMTLGEAFSSARARLVKLTLYSLLIVALLIAWDFAGMYSSAAAKWAASAITFSSQSPVKPASLESSYSWLLRVVFLFVALALHPFAARFAGSLDSAARVLKQPAYWLGGILLAVVGLLIPWWLISWVPAFTAFSMEAVSAIIRFTLAYLLAIVSWVTIAAFMVRVGGSAETSATQ
ncbi:MAG TPA: hypothetical protein VFB63_11385 [Bryobacteraceae bacterium]|jgi:hypothetical protein|nr:hypothetical protein [Bryobacteraceae bacterium]